MARTSGQTPLAKQGKLYKLFIRHVPTNIWIALEKDWLTENINPDFEKDTAPWMRDLTTKSFVGTGSGKGTGCEVEQFSSEHTECLIDVAIEELQQLRWSK